MHTTPNQTPGAKKRIRGLAQASNLPTEIVHALCDLFYDFDPGPTGEPRGWVGRDESQAPQLSQIANYLGLEPDAKLTRGAAIDAVLKAHRTFHAARLWSELEEAGATKNAALLSRFASWHYLRGLDGDLLRELEWPDGDRDPKSIASSLFLKIFRAGSVDRTRLVYVYADLAISFGEAQGTMPPRPWIRSLLEAIESLGPDSTLSQLIRCTSGLVKGNKYFKQTILEALCYAGALRVRGLDVNTFFIPQRRDEMSTHFYSNEWTFPLRFWAQHGGEVDFSVLP